MATTTLRKVGGSVMLAVPKAILDTLDLKAGATVDLDVDGERLMVQGRKKPRYTIDELLDQCETSSGPLSEEDRIWIDLPPVGREL